MFAPRSHAWALLAPATIDLKQSGKVRYLQRADGGNKALMRVCQSPALLAHPRRQPRLLRPQTTRRETPPPGADPACPPPHRRPRLQDDDGIRTASLSPR